MGYLDELNSHEQMYLMKTVNEKKPFEECIVQTKAAKEFFDSLMEDKARLDPIAIENGFDGVTFEYPELDPDDPQGEAIREMMFGDLDEEALFKEIEEMNAKIAAEKAAKESEAD